MSRNGFVLLTRQVTDPFYKGMAGTDPSNKYLSTAVYEPMIATLFPERLFDDFSGLCPGKANSNWSNVPGGCAMMAVNFEGQERSKFYI